MNYEYKIKGGGSLILTYKFKHREVITADYSSTLFAKNAYKVYHPWWRRLFRRKAILIPHPLYGL